MFIIIYAQNIDVTRVFYEDNMGLTFKREKHGRGVEHYAAYVGDTVLEIYPAGSVYTQDGPLAGQVRLGFDGTDNRKLTDPDGRHVIVMKEQK